MEINGFAYSFSTPFYYTIFCSLCAIDSMYVQVLLDWNVGRDGRTMQQILITLAYSHVKL